MAQGARKSRALNKRRPDGRCYDARTKAPDGCCEHCWHESGAEVRGRLYALNVGRLYAEVFVSCSRHSTKNFDIIREGFTFPLEDGHLPWLPSNGIPNGACRICWEEQRTFQPGKTYVFGEESRGTLCETCAANVARYIPLGFTSRPAQGG